MPELLILGVDLAGPSNTEETGLALARARPDGLDCVAASAGWSDAAILERAQDAAAHSRLIVGLDAPLSYEDGGGDRARDKALREAVKAATGEATSSVMPPTLTRMAYLTLRGLTIARLLEGCDAPHGLDILEVHPTCALQLRGLPPSEIAGYKSDRALIQRMRGRLGELGVRGIPPGAERSNHIIAACAAAFAAWAWHTGESRFLAEAAPPHHPYPLCA